jgi:hypothetical protein|tara:strand:- start:3061 stop:3774 length:714 start_codon:yes stop_codon:yes gene_type:complete
MRGIIFKTVKEGFRRLHKAHKSEVARKKRSPNTAPPVIPMDLKKADFKRKIRGTKFMTAAEYKAAPKTKSMPKGGRPRMFGKAFASDKAAKRTMMIPMMTKKQRAANQEAISQSVRKFMKERIGKKSKGGLNTIRMVKRKLEKASKAHAGQAKALGKIIPKKMLGGLLTAGIKTAAKKYFKTGNKTQQIVKKHGGSRSDAKTDVKSGIKNNIAIRLKDKSLSVQERRSIIRDLNKFR